MAYTYQATITVDHTKVAANETDFPVLVSVTNANLKHTSQGGSVTSKYGYDIVPHTDASLTTPIVGFEMEDYNLTTGTVKMWVKQTISASVDTVFYLGVGNSSITARQGTVATTWNSAYKAVYHLGNYNDNAWIQGYNTVGYLGLQGGCFDGTNLYISSGKTDFTHNFGIRKFTPSGSTLGAENAASRDFVLNATGTDTDHCSYTNSIFYLSGYIYVAAPTPFTVGGTDYSATCPRVIRLDATTLAYDSTVLNDLTKPGTFIEDLHYYTGTTSALANKWYLIDAVTPQVFVYNSSWVYQTTYTLTTGGGATGGSPDPQYQGYDGWTMWDDRDGYTYGLAAIHEGYPNTGAVIFRWNGATWDEVVRKTDWTWANQGVNVDPSANDGSIIWAGYRPNNTVSTNYMYKRDIRNWSLTPGTVTDSTGVNTATSTTTMECTAGETAGAAASHGSNGSGAASYIDCGSNASLNPSAGGAITVEAWVNPTTYETTIGHNSYVIKKWGSGGDSYTMWCTTAAVNLMKFSTVASSTNASTKALPSTGSWHYCVGTHSGGSSGSTIFYLDKVAGATGTENFNTSTEPTQIGSDQADGANDIGWNGLIDEVRILNVAKASTYVTTVYNNMTSPSTFFATSFSAVSAGSFGSGGSGMSIGTSGIMVG